MEQQSVLIDADQAESRVLALSRFSMAKTSVNSKILLQPNSPYRSYAGNK